MARRLFTFVLVLVFWVVPAGVQAQAAVNLIDSCVQDFDAETDYFPEEVEIEHTEGFTVEYFNNYKVLTVNTPFPGAEAPLQYVLVQCGTELSEEAQADYADALVVEVPVQRVISLSTTYLPHLDTMGVVETIVGTDEFDYVNTPSVRERIDADEIAEVYSNFEANVELMLELEPDVIFTQAFSGDDTLMQDIGLPVVINSDWLDTTPLGRAEWIKFLALFFNQETVATEFFEGVVERYNALAALTADVEERPTVFLSSAYGDAWYMAGGASYSAQLLADAGAAYIYADDETTASLTLDFESAFAAAAEADYWLNPDQPAWFTLDDVIATDERYAELAAVQNGNVYNNNARINDTFFLDYYESGLANPDLILADMIYIFHPDLLPDHTLYYYQPLG